MTLRLSVVRIARSGRTVRQMTTSVYVFELHTSALGHKASINSIPVQKLGGSGEISQKCPPLDHNLHTSHLDRLRRAMLERPARARATDLGPETLHVPSMGPNEHKSTLA